MGIPDSALQSDAYAYASASASAVPPPPAGYPTITGTSSSGGNSSSYSHEDSGSLGEAYPETRYLDIATRLAALKTLATREMNVKLPDAYLKNPALSTEKREFEVHRLIIMADYLNLQPEALFLAVTLLDLVLNDSTYEVSSFEKLSATCLFEGAAFAARTDPSNVCPPRSEFCKLCQPHAKESEMNQMAGDIRAAIEGLHPNTSVAAMRYMVDEDDHALFLLKLCLSQHEFLKFPASLVAATAITISSLLRAKEPPRITTHVVGSGYPLKEYRECFELLFLMLGDPDKASKIKLRYSKLCADMEIPTAIKKKE